MTTDAITKAATGLEAFFLRQLLAETRPADGGGLDGGFAGDTFHDMLDGAMADKMASAGGVGLAKVIAGSLRHGGGAITSDPATVLDVGVPRPLPRMGAYGPPVLGDAPTRPIDGAGTGELRAPVPGRIAWGFGMRADPGDHQQRFHKGIDLAAHQGDPVSAAAAGDVVRAGDGGTYGNLVVVRHPGGLETRYAHLSEIYVKVGDHVAGGAPIASVGSTGLSLNPHLHFEVYRDGEPVDPRYYMSSVTPSKSRDSGR